MSDFKPAAEPSRRGRSIAAVTVACALVGAGYGVGRATAPEPATAPPATTAAAESGVRYTDGIPSGFPATRRGAGDAAAWYETLLSAAGSRPRTEARDLITKVVDPASQPALVDALMPSTAREGNLNITQTSILRVWAEPAPAGDLAPGTRLKVKTYGMGLFGARTDGTIAQPNAGLAGGTTIHDLILSLTGQGWRLHAVQTPIPAPPPDLRGSTRDGTKRDSQVLAEVLGPDSWIPNMP